MDSKILQVLTLIGFGCSALTSATVVINASYTGQNGASFEVGSNASFTCTISPYGGSLRWKVDTISVADCGFVVCGDSSTNPDRYSFMHNISTGIFIFTISNVTSDDNGKVIECTDGSITDTVTLTIAVTDFVISERCGWCSPDQCYGPLVCIVITVVIGVIIIIIVIFVVTCCLKCCVFSRKKKGKPDPPSDFKLIDDSETDTSAGFQWKPGCNGGHPQSFILTYTVNEMQMHSLIHDIGQDPMKHTLSDLKEGTYYSVKIFAKNTEGSSSLVGPVKFRTKEHNKHDIHPFRVRKRNGPGKPEQPQYFKYIDVTETAITVQWMPGHMHNGGYQQTFVLKCSPNRTEEAVEDGIVDQEQRIVHNNEHVMRYVFGNLQKETYYRLTIYAMNQKGYTPENRSIDVRTNGKPDPPSDFKLIDDSETDTSAGFQWKPGCIGGHPQSFILTYTVNERQMHSLIHDIGRDSMQHTLSDLKEGAYYSVEIFAKNTEGSSSLVGPVIFRTKGKPEQPQDFKYIDVTETAITVQWRPGHNGGYQRTFVLKCSPNRTEEAVEDEIIDQGQRIVHNNEHVMRYVFGNLQKETYYRLTLFAMNQKGHSPENSPIDVRTNGKPEQPQDFKYIDVTGTAITVQWMPGHNGGYQQTFVLKCSPNRTEEVVEDGIIDQEQRIVHNDEHVMRYVFRNLQKETCYRLTIYAKNQKGHTSENSPTDVRTNGKPEQPQDFKYIDVTGTAITVQWMPGHNGGYQQTFVLKCSPNRTEEVVDDGIIDQEQRIVHNDEHVMRYVFRNLQKETCYRLTIYAKNQKGHTSENSPTDVRTNGKLEQPQDFKYIDVTETAITVQWRPGHNGGYQQTFVLKCSPSRTKEAVEDGIIDQDQRILHNNEHVMRYVFRNLQKETYYRLIIYAMNQNDHTPENSPIDVRTNGKPDQPHDFKYIDVTETAITLEWMPGHNGGYQQKFVLKCSPIRTEEAVEDEIIDREQRILHSDEHVMQYVFGNLQKQTCYRITIYAMNQKGHTPENSPIDVRTNGKLEQPQDFKYIDVTETAITVQWMPGNNGGYQQRFVLKCSPKRTEEAANGIIDQEQRILHNNEHVMQYVFGNLQKETYYRLTIYAINQKGHTPENSAIDVRTNGKPEQPQDFKYTDVTETAITVEWRPCHNGGYQQKFVLKCSPSRTKEAVEDGIIDKEQRILHNNEHVMRYVFGNLQKETYYRLTIYAMNQKGHTPENSPIDVRTNGKPEQPQDFKYIDVTETAITVQWRPGHNGGYQQTFVLNCSQNRTEEAVEDGTIDQGQRILHNNEHVMRYMFGKLQKETYYRLTIYAMNQKGHTPENSSIDVRTNGKPDPPSDFKFIDATDTSAVLQWKPGFIGGHPQSFILTYTVNGTQMHSLIHDIGRDPMQHTLSGLSEGTYYSVEIFAKNTEGSSLEVGPVQFRTKGKPDPPTEFRLINDSVTDTSVRFQWKSGDNGGYPQTFILIGDGRQLDSQIKDTAQDRKIHTLSFLKERTEFSVKIFAENIKGRSSLKGPVNFRTKGKPDPPREVKIIDGSVRKTRVGFQWKPGFNGGYPQSFILTYTVNGSQIHSSIEDTGLDPMQHTLRDLSEGTDYSVEIFAQNTKGQSSLEGPFYFRTKGVKHDAKIGPSDDKEAEQNGSEATLPDIRKAKTGRKMSKSAQRREHEKIDNQEISNMSSFDHNVKGASNVSGGGSETNSSSGNKKKKTRAGESKRRSETTTTTLSGNRTDEDDDTTEVSGET